MENFKIISGLELSEHQLDQVAGLLFETGYYEYISLRNKLDLPPIEFQKIQTLKPFAKYTYVLISQQDILGFFIAAKRDQIAEVELNTPNWYRSDDELVSFFEKLSHFYVEETLNTDFVVYANVIKKKYRGMGFYKVLLDYTKELTKKNACNRIIFAVWESNRAARLFFEHDGAEMIGKIDYTAMYFKQHLLKGALKLGERNQND